MRERSMLPGVGGCMCDILKTIGGLCYFYFIIVHIYRVQCDHLIPHTMYHNQMRVISIFISLNIYHFSVLGNFEFHSSGSL